MSFTSRPATSGNMLVIILIAIGLIAALTAVVSQGFTGGKGAKDPENKTKVSQVLRYSSGLRDAVTTIYTNNGASETDLRFAHPNLTGYGTITTTATFQVFNDLGGGANLLTIPSGVNDGSQLEFYGFTRAPDVGVDATPDLMFVIPNVTLPFCQAVNETLGYAKNATPPADSTADSKCIHSTASRFAGTFATGGAINDMDRANFTYKPAKYGCVQCSGPAYHYYYVLLER